VFAVLKFARLVEGPGGGEGLGAGLLDVDDEGAEGACGNDGAIFCCSSFLFFV